MRKPTYISGLKNSQKIRVIVDGVGFYTTVYGTTNICTHSHQVAVTMALQNLAHERSVAQVKRTVAPVGFGFNYRYTADGKTEVLVPVQVDLVD
jgi:hypothetical protein